MLLRPEPIRKVSSPCAYIGPSVAFFFCSRGGVRQLVSIEARFPPAVGEHSP